MQENGAVKIAVVVVVDDVAVGFHQLYYSLHFFHLPKPFHSLCFYVLFPSRCLSLSILCSHVLFFSVRVSLCVFGAGYTSCDFGELNLYVCTLETNL